MPEAVLSKMPGMRRGLWRGMWALGAAIQGGGDEGGGDAEGCRRKLVGMSAATSLRTQFAMMLLRCTKLRQVMPIHTKSYVIQVAHRCLQIV